MDILSFLAQDTLSSCLANQVSAILEHDGVGVFDHLAALTDTPTFLVKIVVHKRPLVFVYHASLL
jgi:hypothetical protein